MKFVLGGLRYLVSVETFQLILSTANPLSYFIARLLIYFHSNYLVERPVYKRHWDTLITSPDTSSLYNRVINSNMEIVQIT